MKFDSERSNLDYANMTIHTKHDTIDATYCNEQFAKDYSVVTRCDCTAGDLEKHIP